MFQRHIESILIELLSEFRILYLTGPRQAGKTTLVKSIAEKLGMQYITLDDQAVLGAVLNDPQGYLRSLGQKKAVLDEFQYAPALIPAIKEISDALPPKLKGKFLLTGSADIFRSAKTQEALPGHLARIELYPLSACEINARNFNIIDFIIKGDFQNESTRFLNREDVARVLINGGYPELQNKSQRSKQIWFNSYIEGRLLKDFESLYTARGDYHSKLSALVRNLAGLSGNLLKYASISNDLGLDDKLVKAYIEILDMMFIVKRVPAYMKNSAKRQVIGMPKLHFVDTGLACHLLGLRKEDQLLQSQFYGGLLENYVYMELCKNIAWAEEEVGLYHFRDAHKNEVDLVLEKSDSRIIGIEIKTSSTVGKQDFKGLLKLAESAGRHFEAGLVFYTGQEILPFNQEGKRLHAIPLSVLL